MLKKVGNINACVFTLNESSKINKCKWCGKVINKGQQCDRCFELWYIVQACKDLIIKMLNIKKCRCNHKK